MQVERARNGHLIDAGIAGEGVDERPTLDVDVAHRRIGGPEGEIRRVPIEAVEDVDVPRMDAHLVSRDEEAATRLLEGAVPNLRDVLGRHRVGFALWHGQLPTTVNLLGRRGGQRREGGGKGGEQGPQGPLRHGVRAEAQVVERVGHCEPFCLFRRGRPQTPSPQPCGRSPI